MWAQALSRGLGMQVWIYRGWAETSATAIQRLFLDRKDDLGFDRLSGYSLGPAGSLATARDLTCSAARAKLKQMTNSLFERILSQCFQALSGRAVGQASGEKPRTGGQNGTYCGFADGGSGGHWVF